MPVDPVTKDGDVPGDLLLADRGKVQSNGVFSAAVRAEKLAGNTGDVFLKIKVKHLHGIHALRLVIRPEEEASGGHDPAILPSRDF